MEFREPLGRNEAIVQNILGADNVLPEPIWEIETILTCILNGQHCDVTPTCSTSEILLAICNGGTYTKPPTSRNEVILLYKLNGEVFEGETFTEMEELLKEWTVQSSDMDTEDGFYFKWWINLNRPIPIKEIEE